jgi:peptide/nickel transport system permease protein
VGRFLIRRLLWAVFLVFAATLVTYSIFFLIPGDPATAVAGKGATPQAVANVRRLLHLDEPAYEQYGRFVWNLVAHGSLGISYVNRADVRSLIEESLPVTASLIVGGALLFLAISIPVGIISALRPRSLFDRMGMFLVLVGISLQPIWLGLSLSWLFGYKLGWTPIVGYCDAFPKPYADCGGAAQWAWHLILPWITFSVPFAALYARMIRSQLMESMGEDYVRTARSKGLSERRIVLRHAARNSMLPVITILGMDVGLAFAAAIFIERTFNLPGIGRQLLIATNQFDLPMICGIVVFVSLIVIALNLVVDIAYGFLDPRIRLTDSVRLG